MAYTIGNDEKKGYAGSLPYYNKCKLHHEGQCTVKCMNYKKVGHMAKDCRTVVAVTAQRALVENQRIVTCFGCSRQGHYKIDCPKCRILD
nr:putative reverse transcriptase domain-containing protein [Tanacetum cinerariifolium]GEZ70248.1 putative reverse transcriptase domain-containing protein [Tanacetum cinerariifolium]